MDNPLEQVSDVEKSSSNGEDTEIEINNNTDDEKASGPISEKSTDALKKWILSSEHFTHPYPSDMNRKQLMEETGLSELQIKNWFTNARRRIWRPLMQSVLNSVDFEPVLVKARMRYAATPVLFEADGSCTVLNDKGPFTSKNATQVLKAWILSSTNFIHPYPSPQQVKQLSLLTGLSPKQLKNWFTNSRRRIWKPIMKKVIAKIDLDIILVEARAKVLFRGNKAALSSKETCETVNEQARACCQGTRSQNALAVLSDLCSRAQEFCVQTEWKEIPFYRKEDEDYISSYYNQTFVNCYAAYYSKFMGMAMAPYIHSAFVSRTAYPIHIQQSTSHWNHHPNFKLEPQIPVEQNFVKFPFPNLSPQSYLVSNLTEENLKHADKHTPQLKTEI